MAIHWMHPMHYCQHCSTCHNGLPLLGPPERPPPVRTTHRILAGNIPGPQWVIHCYHFCKRGGSPEGQSCSTTSNGPTTTASIEAVEFRLCWEEQKKWYRAGTEYRDNFQRIRSLSLAVSERRKYQFRRSSLITLRRSGTNNPS